MPTFPYSLIKILTIPSLALALAGQSENRLAEGFRLLADARAACERDPGLAILLAEEGRKRAPGRRARETLAAVLMKLREARTFFLHRGGASAACFSHDGARIATASRDGWIAVWDAQTGALLEEMVSGKNRFGRGRVPEMLAFSPDGSSLLVSYDYGVAKLWRLGGSVMHAFDHAKGKHTTRDRIARFTSDGSRVLAGVVFHNGGHSVDSRAYLFDARSRKELRRLDGIEPDVSLDGKFAVTREVRPRLVRIYSLAAPWPVVEVKTPKWPAEARFARQGKSVLVHVRKAIVRYDLAGKLLATYPIDGVIRGSADDSSGRWLAVTLGQRVQIFDQSSQKVATSFDDRGLAIEHMVFDPSGAVLACGSSDGRVSLRRPSDGRELASLRGHSLPLTGMAFDAEGKRLITASEDGTVRIWRVDHPSVVTLDGFERGSTGKTTISSVDGRLAYAGSYTRGVGVWDIATGAKAYHIQAQYPRTPVWLDRQRSWLLQDTESTLVWGREGRTAKLFGDSRDRAFAVSPQGTYVARWDTGKVRLHSLTGQSVRALESGQDEIDGLGFSSDGKSLFGVDTGLGPDQPPSITHWEAASGREVWSVGLPRGEGKSGIVEATATASLRHVAVSTGPESLVHVLSRADGSVIKTLAAHRSGAVTVLKFSPDGRRLVTAGGNWTARLWDVETWRCLAVAQRDQSWSWETWWPKAQVRFSSDGLWLGVAFQQENSVRVFSARDGSLRFHFREPRGMVQTIEFSESGQYLMVATRAGRVFHYPMIPVIEARRRRPRELSAQDFARHMVSAGSKEKERLVTDYLLAHRAKVPASPRQDLQELWQAQLRGLGSPEAVRHAQQIADRCQKRLPGDDLARWAAGAAALASGKLESALELLIADEDASDMPNRFAVGAFRTLALFRLGKDAEAEKWVADLEERLRHPDLQGHPVTASLMQRVRDASKK